MVFDQARNLYVHEFNSDMLYRIDNNTGEILGVATKTRTWESAKPTSKRWHMTRSKQSSRSKRLSSMPDCQQTTW